MSLSPRTRKGLCFIGKDCKHLCFEFYLMNRTEMLKAAPLGCWYLVVVR